MTCTFSMKTTMPDFDLLIELAKYYEVEVGEILDGERGVSEVIETHFLCLSNRILLVN